jgi:hypothetical protein
LDVVTVENPKLFLNWVSDYVNQAIESFNSADDCRLHMKLGELANYDGKLWELYRQRKSPGYITPDEDVDRGSGWVLLFYNWHRLFPCL